MFIFEPGYSIPRLCCFFFSLWLSSLLIRRMFILQEILIPTIPKIRSMSEGTIWLNGDWTVNSSRLTLSLSFFLQFFEALCLWIRTSCSIFQDELQQILTTSIFCIWFLLRVFRVEYYDYHLRASLGTSLNCVYVVNAGPCNIYHLTIWSRHSVARHWPWRSPELAFSPMLSSYLMNCFLG